MKFLEGNPVGSAVEGLRKKINRTSSGIRAQGDYYQIFNHTPDKVPETVLFKDDAERRETQEILDQLLPEDNHPAPGIIPQLDVIFRKKT